MRQHIIVPLVIIFLACTAVWLCPNHVSAQPSASTEWKLLPQIITTASQVDVCSLTGGPPCNQAVWLCWMDASTGAAATNFSLADRQATPVVRPNSVSIPAYTWWTIPLQTPGQSCAWYPGGLRITVANASALTIQMSGKY